MTSSKEGDTLQMKPESDYVNDSSKITTSGLNYHILVGGGQTNDPFNPMNTYLEHNTYSPSAIGLGMNSFS